MSLFLSFAVYCAPRPPCSLETESEGFSSVKKLLAEDLLKEALLCVSKLSEKFPKSRDLSYYKARILAWHKKFDEALKELAPWNGEDLESLLLKADIYWYQGDCEKAYAFYQKAEKEGSLKDFPETSALSYLKCSNLLSEKLSTSITSQYPKLKKQSKADENLPNLKSKEKNAPGKRYEELTNEDHTFVLVETSKNVQPEGRSSSEYRFYAEQRVYKPFSLILEVFDIYRKFPGSTKNDQILVPGFQLEWSKNHKSKFKTGFSINADFSYKNTQEINHTSNFGPTYLALTLRRTEFTDTSLYLYSPTIGHYIGNFHFAAQFFHGISGSKHSFAFLLSGQYNHPYFLTSLWGGIGKGESTIPYVLNTLESVSFTYGVKFGLILASSFQPYFIFEGRIEEKVHQSTFKLGASWSI